MGEEVKEWIETASEKLKIWKGFDARSGLRFKPPAAAIAWYYEEITGDYRRMLSVSVGGDVVSRWAITMACAMTKHDVSLL